MATIAIASLILLAALIALIHSVVGLTTTSREWVWRRDDPFRFYGVVIGRFAITAIVLICAWVLVKG